VALLQRDLDRTAECLGRVRAAYDSLLDPFVRRWPTFSEHVLDTPFRIPSAPILMGRIGLCALRSTTALARKFGTAEARALLAGNAAHSGAMLERVPSAATLLLFAAGNVFLQSVVYSFGEFHHPEGLMMIGLVVLALSPSGRALSLDAWWATRNQEHGRCRRTRCSVPRVDSPDDRCS
jgi:hypothetical protein